MKLKLLSLIVMLAVSFSLKAQIITTVVGNGTAGFSGDGGLATYAQIDGGDIAFDSFNNLYFSDNYRIRKVDYKTGIITTIAGNGVQGYSGDNGPAIFAGFQNSGEPITIDPKGNIYIIDSSRLRKIDISTGVISTVAGNNNLKDSGDGGLAVNASIYPWGYMASDKLGNIYLSCFRRIRKIDANTKIITTLIGNGKPSYITGNGPTAIGDPWNITFDTSNNVIFTSGGDAFIYIVNPAVGTKAHLTGYNLSCMFGMVEMDLKNNLYMTTDVNECTGGYNVVPQIMKTGLGSSPSTFIAGTNIPGYSGDNGLGSKAQIDNPSRPVCDNFGDIYFGDFNNYRIRKIKMAIVTPLKFGSFNIIQNKNNIFINWQTANETNTSHFNIQRSVTGKDFTAIGKVNAKGASKYTFNDQATPTSKGGILYYRLEVVDKDGSKTYSEVRELRINNEELRISPNPAYDFVTVSGNNLKQVSLIDFTGRTVITKEVNSNSIKLAIGNLSKGIYMVKATLLDGSVQTEKLVVD